jgi:hypothetical protein
MFRAVGVRHELEGDLSTMLTGPTPSPMVRDDVVFSPPLNPLAGIERARERMQQGKSIFVDLPKREVEKASNPVVLTAGIGA